jgi:hypothetical protein
MGDEPGLGKTAQAIGVLTVTKAFPALVICPASLKVNWQRELRKFGGLAGVILNDDNKQTWQRFWEMKKADGRALSALISQGITPVMAPLTHDGMGNILNTNADTIAGETAKALAPYYDVTLIYSFEKKGVLSNPDDDESVIPVITRDDFARYVADGTVAGGMIPKLENAFDAISSGVSRVIITLATAIDGEHGTIIKE